LTYYNTFNTNDIHHHYTW